MQDDDSGDGLLTPRRVAALADFTVGPMVISPSRRTLSGPRGSAEVQPRVVQALICLAEAPGQVVTRETMFQRCWGGSLVGDDSLNRSVAGARQAIEKVAGAAVTIQTISRTGYCLTINDEAEPLDAAPQEAALQADAEGAAPPRGLGLSRRTALIGGGAVAAAAAGAALLLGQRQDPRATAAIARGRRILRDSMPGTDLAAAAAFRQAIAHEPHSAEAWGLLALALRNIAEQAPPARVADAVARCEAAARRALEIERSEPNALTALATVQPEFGNWGESEDRIRAILRDAPDNVPALTFLVMILQSVGRASESWDINERAVALEPLSPLCRFRRALKLWIMDRVAEADLEIDRALQRWPRNPGVWNARLYIFAFTGRPEAALAMLHDVGERPPKLRQESVTLWTTSLRALETRSAADIDRAREANIHAAPRSPTFGMQSTMILAMLGELDAAFGVAEGMLLRRGPLVGKLWSSPRDFAASDNYWRRTMNLFTPATAAMRRDPRFAVLCEGIGLTRYWREKRRGPDRFLMR